MVYKYKTVADLIKQGIYTGKYKPGEKLPSIQRLSMESGYNSDTIVKAYKLLEAEHFIFSVPKSGYYVVKSLTGKDGKDSLVDMNRVCSPDSINPYKDYYHCMEKAIELYENKLFEYSDPKGMTELINVLVKYLMGSNIFTRAENIFITNGAQQALFILGSMPFLNARTKILVEQPTYSVMLQALKCNEIPVVGIERTSEGINLNELESLFKQGDIKFFYTMPRYQNPTGFSYDYPLKRNIVKLAKKYGIYIIEDDYLADLELDKKSDPLYVMGEKDLIIYVRSFSKTLLPGLRLGMCILPAALQGSFLSYKQSIDLNTSIITQGALEIYLKSKMYKSHIQRTRKYYNEKMDLLRRECKYQSNGAMKWHIPPTGLYAYLELNGVSAEVLTNRLSTKGVLVSNTSNCYIKNFHHPEGIRLSVCKADDSSIRRVVKLIEQELGD